MPRTSGPIFTNKQSSAPAQPQPPPGDVSKRVVEELDKRERQKERARAERRKRAKQAAVDAIALKLAKMAAKRFVLTPLVFKYFGFLTNQYHKSGGLTKLAVSKPYFALADLVVTRLVNVTTRLVIAYITELYKKLVKQSKEKKHGLALKALNLKIRIAVKTGNFDSLVAFLKDSFMWPHLAKSKEFVNGIKLLKKLYMLKNPKSMSDIQNIIKVTAEIARWSKGINNAKLKKLISSYSKSLNKGLVTEKDFDLKI